MSAQPEALRLADEWLRKTRSEADRRNSAYDHYGMGNTPENVDPLGAKMVAELRRLHASCEDYAQHKQRQDQRVLELNAQRDALLEALTVILNNNDFLTGERLARAAIKAVEGTK